MSEPKREPLAKTLIIGVDGGEPSLFEAWMASGDMPNLAKLRARSLGGRTKNPRALEAGSVWPVFHTGLLPAHQPQFDGQRFFDSETYSYRWFEREAVEPSLWQHLSSQGKRCLVIDAPYVRLDPSVNGAMILDWGSHVAADGQNMTFQTHPAELRDELLSVVGDDPTGGVQCDRRKLESAADYKGFFDNYMERIAKKGELTRYMLEKGGWDFAEVVFTDLHCMGHQLWHLHDASHPQHNPSVRDALGGDPMLAGYKAFDAAIGHILDCLDERTTVLFFSSHGMGPQHTGTGLLDRVLQAIEEGKPVPATRPLKARVREVWHKVPGEIRASLRALRKPFKGALDTTNFIPQENRRFFEVYANNATGGVRLNLKGREAKGIVEPDEARGILEDLRAAVMECRNVETGEPFVEDCIITRDHYQGDYDKFLPDMLITWNRKAPIRVVSSPRVGTIHQDYANFRTGDHTPFGMFLAAGPQIIPGALNDDVKAQDFAPTLLGRMGCTMPRTDGDAVGPLSGAGG